MTDNLFYSLHRKVSNLLCRVHLLVSYRWACKGYNKNSFVMYDRFLCWFYWWIFGCNI